MSMEKPSQDIVIELDEVLEDILCVTLVFPGPDLNEIDLETSNVET